MVILFFGLSATALSYTLASYCEAFNYFPAVNISYSEALLAPVEPLFLFRGNWTGSTVSDANRNGMDPLPSLAQEPHPAFHEGTSKNEGISFVVYFASC